MRPTWSDEDGMPAMIPEEDWVRYVHTSGLLFPLGPLKFRWDLFMLILIVYSCISVPFRFGMDHDAEGGWLYFEAGVSLCFITDIVLVFNTAYVEGDRLILDRARIRTAYLRGWFIIDVLSSLPLELLDIIVYSFFPEVLTADDESNSNALRVFRALRLVRMLRLLRLLKLAKIQQCACCVPFQHPTSGRAPSSLSQTIGHSSHPVFTFHCAGTSVCWKMC